MKCCTLFMLTLNLKLEKLMNVQIIQKILQQQKLETIFDHIEDKYALYCGKDSMKKFRNS